MFLKRIELSGFKSFAKKTIIEFGEGINAIIGPNGCGKSNISDAIRWVLGEVSAKSMRSNSMDELIFSGSKYQKAVNMAKVSLVFDNSKRVFNIDYHEVEFTRIMYRGENKNEYYINKNLCRLKDITELIIDANLAKDSLSIISQGNVSSFADARPEERRLVFEEASGISKYKKRKSDSQNKLNKVAENLSRLDDIIAELEINKTKLEKQAVNAQKFLELKTQLEKYELKYLVDNLSELEQLLKQFNLEKRDCEQRILNIDNDLLLNENEHTNLKKILRDKEVTIQKLQQQLLLEVDKLQKLKEQQLDLRLKANSSNQVDYQLEELMLKINQLQNRREIQSKQIIELDLNLDSLKLQQQELMLQKEEFNHKNHQLKQQLQQLEIDISVYTKLQSRDDEKYKSVKELIRLRHPKVYGQVKDIFNIDDGYEKLMSTAINSIAHHLVVEDEQVAIELINYLKQNRLNKVNFIPLSNIKTRVREEKLELIASNYPSFVGFLDNLVITEQKFEQLKAYLFNNTIVVDKIDDANSLARQLNFKSRIISLDADVINVGGFIAGGYLATNQNIYLYNKLLQQLLKNQKDKLEQQRNLNLELNNLELQITQIEQQIYQVDSNKIRIMALNHSINEQLEKLELDLSNQKNQLTSEQIDQKLFSMNGEIENISLTIDDLKQQLSFRSENIELINSQVNTKDVELRKLRQLQRELDKMILNLDGEIKLKTQQMDNYLHQLNTEYQISYQSACQKVEEYDYQEENTLLMVSGLKSQIRKLGSINLDSIESLAELKERYDNLINQKIDLVAASDDLKQAIEQMDQMMIRDFTTSFELINQKLMKIFNELFKGGQAQLVLENPNDILTSGVDILVSFPGKKLNNLRLFSGGEKSLIAISVLFAIIEAKAIPLCVFDEIEAALDAVNVEKLANYLKRLQSTTQFILVTHRSATMSKCDNLFGVTMQEPGVSSIFKVELKQALKIVKE